MTLRKLIHMIRSSFSLRMTLYILMVAAAVFLLAFMANLQSARKYVRSEAIEHVQVALDNTVLQIDQVLNSVETAIQNIAWLVEDKLDNPDYMYELTRQVLRSNPHVVGSAIAFEPYYYPEKGGLYSPYSYRVENGIQSKQLGTEDYDYHYMDWYQIPKLLDKPYWSEPYFDEGGADVTMTTYSYPLYDGNGKLYAVFTADISLEWFAGKVNEVKPYPHSFNNNDWPGRYVPGTPTERSYPERDVFCPSYGRWRPKGLEVGHKMVNGETGMTTFDREGDSYYLFYAPVKATGWSIAVACLYSDVFASVSELTVRVVVFSLLGLLLLAGVCFLAIRRLTKPLTRFAQSATEIAEGNFMATLPDIHSQDEMRTLHQSFGHMQQSLVNYIDELQKTTANKERIESELRIARNIQMGMVPKMFPAFPERDDVDLYAKLIPAKEVGETFTTSSLKPTSSTSLSVTFPEREFRPRW